MTANLIRHSVVLISWDNKRILSLISMPRAIFTTDLHPCIFFWSKKLYVVIVVKADPVRHAITVKKRDRGFPNIFWVSSSGESLVHWQSPTVCGGYLQIVQTSQFKSNKLNKKKMYVG